jgi:hypothetical protein
MDFQPDKAPYEVYGEDRRCTAMSKQARRRCRQLAAPASDKCRFHGGWSLRGKYHPAYQDGEATKQARAYTVWIGSLGVAMRKIERARTPKQIAEAKKFAWTVLANKPERR